MLPVAWATFEVGNRNDQDFAPGQPVDDLKWKTVHQDAAGQRVVADMSAFPGALR